MPYSTIKLLLGFTRYSVFLAMAERTAWKKPPHPNFEPVRYRQSKSLGELGYSLKQFSSRLSVSICANGGGDNRYTLGRGASEESRIVAPWNRARTISYFQHDGHGFPEECQSLPVSLQYNRPELFSSSAIPR